jgi:GNAT superfamily N-acetyltransferase
MANPVEVRPATVADRGAATRLLTAQMEEHGFSVEADGIARAVELALSPGASAWLVIGTIGGLPAGVLLANPLVSVEKGGAALWIEELYVAPAHRRRGVARALIAYVAREARNSGLNALDLEVEPSQKAAMALYPGLGFRPLDRRRFTLDLVPATG